MCQGIEKMKVLIITVAGMSSRFSQSVGHDVVKSLYYSHNFSESLLYRLVHQPVDFDKYIIVGGYRYKELAATISKYFPEMEEKIEMVENLEYMELGSGYSLYCGLKKALEYDVSEIVFAEGDLYVDSSSYIAICESEQNVITYNTEPILSDKAVAFYCNINQEIRYIYDTGHKALEIKEPFLAVYNSGQIWKFSEIDKVRVVFDRLLPAAWEGTNLVFIEEYFNYVAKENISLKKFDKWINCNTVQDFYKIKE